MGKYNGVGVLYSLPIVGHRESIGTGRGGDPEASGEAGLGTRPQGGLWGGLRGVPREGH